MSTGEKICFALGLVGLCIDQVTKQYAIYQNVATFNSGVALGILSENNTLVGIVSIVVLLGLLLFGWFRRQKMQIYVLVIAATSNLIDRMRFGAVVDWLPIPGTQIVNNIADWMLAIGLCWLLLTELQTKSRLEK